MHRRNFIGAALAVTVALTLHGQAQAQEHKWRIQGYLPDSFQINKDFRDWATGLKDKSGGAIEIEFLPVGAVVGVTETLDAMKTGVLTGHFTGASYFAGKDPAFSVIGDTLAAYESPAEQSRWWGEGGGKELMRELYAAHGAHVVGPLQSPSEVIPSSKPLNSMADFQGLKIRSVQGTVADLFTKMGAGVVVLPGTEVFNALQTGVITSTDWGWYDLNEKTGLYQVAKYSVDARHSMGMQEFSISQRAWDRLTPELQTLVETEFASFSAKMAEQFTADEEAAKKRVVDAGVTIIEWDADKLAEIRKLTNEVWADLATRSPMAKRMVDSHSAFVQKLHNN